MERKRLSTVARQFKQELSQQVLNGLGKAVRFCFRVRAITPDRLALGLIEVFATMQVKTIADVRRAFNALCNTDGALQAFPQSVSEGHVSDFHA